MGNELVVQQQALSIDDAEKLSQMVALAEYGTDKEKLIGTNMLRIKIGESMGLAPGAALKGINIIKGKPELSSALMAGMIDNSPDYNFNVVETTKEYCKLEFLRRQGDQWIVRGTSTFSMEEAKKAELIKTPKFGVSPWVAYPETMLYWRAMSNGFRRFCPGLAMGNVYIEGEVSGEVNNPEPPPEPKNVTPQKVDKASIRDTITVLKALIEQPKGNEMVEQEREKARSELSMLLAQAIDNQEWTAKQLAAVEKILDTPIPE